jgi:DnaJ-domain-containing protein 1
LLEGIFALAPDAATLAALAAIVPVWLALYLTSRSRARRARPELALGRLEAIELERALLLYEKAARRRQEIYRQRARARAPWRGWYRRRAEFRKAYGRELEELERYVRDLRATIIRLRGRPIRRYRSWIRAVSSRCALGRSLGCYGATLALLAIASWWLEPSTWGPGADADLQTFVLWQGFDGRLLIANWMAESFAAASAPLLYALRRAQLRRTHAAQLAELRAFAALDPDRLIEERRADARARAAEAEAATDEPKAGEVPEAPLAARTWFEVLRVAPSATIEEVKQAYKLLIKQNHPDRVASMAPVFRELAEAETKKLNTAYAEALSYFRQDDAATAGCEG